MNYVPPWLDRAARYQAASPGTGDQLKIDCRPISRTDVKDRLAGMESTALAGTTR
jgi:hypothetical protein